MAYSRPTLETIYSRIKADMEARITGGVKIPKFSLLGIMAIVFAGAMHLLYGYLDRKLNQVMVDTATGSDLDRLANMYNTPRKAAAFASGQVDFTGDAGTLIEEGTELQNEAGIRFAVVSDVTLTGSPTTADVQCTVSGEIGNNTDASLFLVSPIDGADTEAAVTTTIEGGVDLETDDELRARVLFEIRNPPASGNIADYERWALSRTGVGKAWCIPADEYMGAGTVAVIIATSALEVVDAAVKTDVTDYIEEVRPVGAAIDVLDIDAKDTDYTIEITPYDATTIAAVEASLETLHLTEAEPSGTILLSHIRAAVAAAGVQDYEITDIEVDSVSIGVANIVMTDLEVARYNSATITELV